VVFGFNDVIYVADTNPANTWIRRLKPRVKTAAICRLAAHITVANKFLAEFAGRHASRMTAVQSTIDTEAYQVRPRGRNRMPGERNDGPVSRHSLHAGFSLA
jgi:hypothetical protein